MPKHSGFFISGHNQPCVYFKFFMPPDVAEGDFLMLSFCHLLLSGPFEIED